MVDVWNSYARNMTDALMKRLEIGVNKCKSITALSVRQKVIIIDEQ